MRSMVSALPVLLLLLAEGKSNAPRAFKGTLIQKLQRHPFLVARGGASAIVVDDEDLDLDDEEDEEDQEEDDELDPVLTKAAIKSTNKAQNKKASRTKQAISAKLKKPKKSSGGLMKSMKVPYIVRACMNPFTVFSMTRAYFASLFNLNYLQKDDDSSQNLRSAMEEKAKKSGGAGGRKGKRQMKPGQAKTLSDLPQLSA